MMGTESPAKPRLEDVAIPPGELLLEELSTRGLSQRRLAALMGRPVQAVNEIVKGKKAITAETALQLEAALGVDAQLWLGLEARYRLILAKQDPKLTRRRRRIAEDAAAYGIDRGSST